MATIDVILTVLAIVTVIAFVLLISATVGAAVAIYNLGPHTITNAGTIIGWVNGTIITRFRINAFFPAEIYSRHCCTAGKAPRPP